MFGFLKNFRLLPERLNYPQLLISVHIRNKWLIGIRTWVSVILAVCIGISFILKLNVYLIPFGILCASIFIYNYFFSLLWKKLPEFHEKFPKINSLHFSVLQISADCFATMFFVYFTGGVEAPFYALFIFQVIIGSLILPGAIVNVMIIIILAVTLEGAIMEYAGSIPHHTFMHIFNFHLYKNEDYIKLHFTVYGCILFASNYIANSIAKELYKREKSLVDANNRIGDAEKAKSRYVMSVVHDLKTPISAATTYMNLLADGTLGKLKPDLLRIIERSKKRLSDAISTINDVLQISQLKIEAGTESLKKVNLYRIFDEIYSDAMIIMVSKGLEYSFETDSDEDVFIESDPKLLKLALANLVSNAFKYTEAGGKIQVDISDKKDYVVISVADSGIGIPESEKEKIFQDFYRTSISKKKGIEGSGLGMSVVLHFVKRMNGTIQVESPSRLATEGSPGSDFILNLPKKQNRLKDTVAAGNVDDFMWI